MTHPLITQARTLAAQVAPRGAEIEALRRIPPDISRAMGEAGFYRMFVGEPVGGLEVSPRVAAEVYEALAQGDAACGWWPSLRQPQVWPWPA